MNLVRQRYTKDVLVGLPEMCEIGFLSLLPARLTLPSRCVGKAIRTSLDDPSHALTEPVADILQPRLASLIFNAIVR